jgi:hypothetical protein
VSSSQDEIDRMMMMMVRGKRYEMKIGLEEDDSGSDDDSRFACGGGINSSFHIPILIHDMSLVRAGSRGWRSCIIGVGPCVSS